MKSFLGERLPDLAYDFVDLPIRFDQIAERRIAVDYFHRLVVIQSEIGE